MHVVEQILLEMDNSLTEMAINKYVGRIQKEDEEEEDTPHGALLRTFRWCRTCDKKGYISKGVCGNPVCTLCRGFNWKKSSNTGKKKKSKGVKRPQCGA